MVTFGLKVEFLEGARTIQARGTEVQRQRQLWWKVRGRGGPGAGGLGGRGAGEPGAGGPGSRVMQDLPV